MTKRRIADSNLSFKPVTIAEPGRSNHEWRNQGAFAALTQQGAVLAWGRRDDGGIPPPAH